MARTDFQATNRVDVTREGELELSRREIPDLAQMHKEVSLHGIRRPGVC